MNDKKLLSNKIEHHTFEDKMIGTYMEFLWPPTSPDITNLGFFMELLKRRPLKDIDFLERIIREACEGTTHDVIRNIIKEFN